MKELLYSIFYNEYFVLIISIIILVIIFKLLMKNKYRPYFEIKDITFTILKDKINNIYIYCNKFENIDEGIHYLYMGKIFINNDDLFGIYEIRGNSSKIEVFDYDNKEEFRISNIKNIAEINFKNNNISKYVMDINSKKIEGVFELINEPKINIKKFNIYKFGYLKNYGELSIILSYLFNFYYAFIDNKEKINFDINGESSFSKDFQYKKENELSDEINSFLKKFPVYELRKYFIKIKDLYAFNILYFDEKTICMYKRLIKIEDSKEIIINNVFLIYDLNNQKLVTPYLKDLVNDAEKLLKECNAPSDFYSNIDNLIFGITDSFIIIMKEKGYEKIFINNKNIKEYINKEHYLAYLFNWFLVYNKSIMSNKLKTIINIFAVIIIVASVNIIISSFSMMIFYNKSNLFYIIDIIALLFIINSVLLFYKKNYKAFIIGFVLILLFSFVFAAYNYVIYAWKSEKAKIIKKDKEVHNSLDRALAKERFFKAAERGDIERIKELMDYVDINAKDAYGINALMHALIFNNLESVEFLLENGADVNSADYEYQTPLMYAVQKNNAEIVNLLISKGADLNAKDMRDRTALDIAKLKGYADIAAILNNAKKKNIKK